MTGAMRAEILSSLAAVRDDVERHVAKLDRYRALQALEKTVADFPGLDDLSSALSEIRERMQRQIEETREVRALRAVEKIMPELTEVLAFLTERREEAPVEQTQMDRNIAPDQDASPPEPLLDADRQPSDQATIIVATSAELGEVSSAPQSAGTPHETAAQEAQHAAAESADPGETPPPANDISGSDRAAPSAAPSTISYGIAQFLNPDEERPVIPETVRGEEGLAPFHSPPSQEGRAA
jgi:hypothetical protein